MANKFTLAVTGDSSLRRRLSVHKEEAFLSLVKTLREADVAFTNLESPIHDYDGPEVYPSESGGGTWTRAPSFMADELKWMGFNIVSRANNHTLDYSYGAMFNTSRVLDEVGIIHAGAGKNLAEAREPAYLDTKKGRVALISMCSTFTRWQRAGEQRKDVKGRPGLNPLRYYYVVDSKLIEMIKEIYINVLNMEFFQEDNIFYFVRPGTHNSVHKFVLGEKPGAHRVALEEDVEGNLRSIREARKRADLVIVQLHFHEWELGKGIEVPGEFVPPFARKCIDAGADAFIGQGAHSLRGIEIYKDKPIFYEPQTFASMGKPKRLPEDYYRNPMYQKYARVDLSSHDAMPSDVFEARNIAPLFNWLHSQPIEARSSYLGLCKFGEDMKLIDLKIYPIMKQGGKPPMLADKDMSRRIIEYLRKLSKPYGTAIELNNGIGIVKL